VKERDLNNYEIKEIKKGLDFGIEGYSSIFEDLPNIKKKIEFNQKNLFIEKEDDIGDVELSDFGVLHMSFLRWATKKTNNYFLDEKKKKTKKSVKNESILSQKEFQIFKEIYEEEGILNEDFEKLKIENEEEEDYDENEYLIYNDNYVNQRMNIFIESIENV
jgi:hypothetical protein